MTVWNLLAMQPAYFITLVALLGLLAGSFLNVLVHRLPIMLERQWRREAQAVLNLPVTLYQRFDLCLPASHCPGCGQRIRAWQNIPLLSYLALGGRCGACKASISLRYPLVEAACALLSLAVAWRFGPSAQALMALLLTWCLLALSLIDARHQLLPDVLVLPMLWLGLIVNCAGLYVPLSDALWGAVAGYLSLWAVYWAFKLLTNKEGMGFGDFKLMALIGAWGGWQVLPLTLLLSSVVGAVVGLCLVGLRRHALGTPIPFGPYLAIAGWIAVLWGDEIHLSYMQLLGYR
ncbi:prepilin peptidase [Pseudomonas parafulva]|uniref:prepilin peptidase n=1 Tax=Pseudomonas parafulva TaxID=157782 RepID=UPI00048C4980|nr:A24 family peptidase [Pseudomonas parafulva]